MQVIDDLGNSEYRGGVFLSGKFPIFAPALFKTHQVRRFGGYFLFVEQCNKWVDGTPSSLSFYLQSRHLLKLAPSTGLNVLSAVNLNKNPC